ncbi:acyl-CoA dehydrogenase family protein [Spirillospora sp. CA-253888]
MTVTAQTEHSVETVARAAALHADRNDAEARFPVEALDAMRATGLLGHLVPPEYGGPGRSVREMADAAYRLARHCTSTAMIFAMHCQQTAAVVGHASPELRRELLPRIAAGELYLASVTTEQKTGGHLLTSAAESSQTGDLLRIDRFAPVCTGGSVADGFLISMLSPKATRETDTSLVYADRSQLDVLPKGGWNPLGMRATDSRPLHLTGRVPAAQTVGADGGFRRIVVDTFAPLGHIGWAACWLGCADGALARVTQRLRRQGSGLPELARRRLARVRMRSDAVHAMLRQAAEEYDRSPRSLTTAVGQLLVNGLKVFASEQTLRMADELIELAGMKDGYMADSPLALERAWRDLRSAPLNYGNDRLEEAGGALVLMDPETSHV